MSEIGHAFRKVERPNVRADTLAQPFYCALRSFAKERLERMKYHFYRIKIRRIFWQVAQACTDRSDHFVHASNLVEWDVVDHHNVPTLERWNQTLLYVGQERLSIHGSFDQ